MSSVAHSIIYSGTMPLNLYTSLRLLIAVAIDACASPPPPLILLLLGPLIVPLILYELLFASSQVLREQQRVNRRDKGTLFKMPPLFTCSAVELSARIRSGKATSRAVTEACIERLRRCERIGINAVTCARYDEALDEADAADEAVRAGKIPQDWRGALWGVPCVVKECFEMPELPFTSGIGSLKGRVGQGLCPAIARLDGQPILATTNVSEACMFHESANVLYGRTRNPHDLTRSPGGSSGGCAAVVAACAAPLAVTSDVGGSTRIPALYCGLFAHKPTGGTIPNTQTLPHVFPDSMVSRFCQLGPTARHAIDLWPLLCKLAGPDGTDQMVRATSKQQLLSSDPHGVDIKGLTVIVLQEPFMPWLLRSRHHPELQKAQARAADALEELGCKVMRLDGSAMRQQLPEVTWAFSIWGAMLGAAQPVRFRTLISDGRSEGEQLTFFGALRELVACVLGGGQSERHTLPAIALALLEDIEGSFPAVQRAMIRQGEALRSRLDAMLGDGHTVLLAPSLLTPAPRHHENLLRFPDAAQTALFNVMQLPVTAVPLGKTAEAGGPFFERPPLPRGCQVVAGFGDDQNSLAVAIALERAGIARAVTAW